MDCDGGASGPTRVDRRATAPDLARGLMLALIALANVHLFLYADPIGARGYPVPQSTADRVVTVLQLTLVDARAYPLFAALLGYGLVRAAARGPASATARRGGVLLGIGAAHGILLFSGDILGAYGVITLLLAPAVAVAPGVLLVVAAFAVLLSVAVGAPSGAVDGTSYQPSAGVTDAGVALGMRAAEWPTVTVVSAVLVLPAALVGMWAGRRGVLDDPARHRRLLAVWAAVGLPAGVLLGLPLALTAAGLRAPSASSASLEGFAHTAGGFAGALGWLGLLGLAATVRLPGRALVSGAGTWSLTLYVTQSLVFALLLAGWAGDGGSDLTVAGAAVVALAVWAVQVLVAGTLARRGHRGPLELLLRRLAYGI